MAGEGKKVVRVRTGVKGAAVARSRLTPGNDDDETE